MKILIAEDDELMLRTLEFRLKKDGHTIFMARDGREALEQIDSKLPDLVITDIMMPYSSGMEIVGFLKQKYNNEIKVIILSGMGQENVILEAFRLGADDYITKPFSPNELSVRVNRFLAGMKNTA
ncbi:response regulator transcription factor [Daejeonella lutea]|uniref:Response regulator receiver domain-containing protein n=1 Tax=Daejeonella lutea TaxID=572036 RepID=A0A1T5A8D4_9SPHI|nr:response regulator [Daejeonella lutea]SKB31180.1 Response regulator receiver domain-containing protein [Daejeonella lutea]